MFKIIILGVLLLSFVAVAADSYVAPDVKVKSSVPSVKPKQEKFDSHLFYKVHQDPKQLRDLASEEALYNIEASRYPSSSKPAPALQPDELPFWDIESEK